MIETFSFLAPFGMVFLLSKLATKGSSGREKLSFLLIPLVPLGITIFNLLKGDWSAVLSTTLLTSAIFSLALPKLIKGDRESSPLFRRKTLYPLFLIVAGFLVYWGGFRIQFTQLAFSENYFYFTGLSIPLTLGWLFVISRSVELFQRELTGRRWRLFLVTVALLILIFLILVFLQRGQGVELKLGAELSLGLLGSTLALIITGKGKRVAPTVAAQLGFLLAAIAISGVVKSLMAFVLVVPMASLTLPLTRKSLAFSQTEASGLSQPGSIADWFTHRWGSRGLGLVAPYILLGYLGLGGAWYLWSPGLGPLTILLSAPISISVTLVLFSGATSALDRAPIRMKEKNKRVEIFGVNFHPYRLEEVVRIMVELAKDRRGEPSYVATPDVTAVIKSKNSTLLKEAYGEADLVTPDGFGIIWGANKMNLSLQERAAGIDILNGLFGCGKKLEVYLLGSKPGVAEEAGQYIERNHEQVEIVGTHHGYFPLEDETVLEEINEKSPDLLLVGMGVPRQEKWVLSYKDSLEVGLVMGVGGSFDVLSGQLSRAPEMMQEMGLEWLYRTLLEPRRLWRVRLIPIFMLEVYWEMCKKELKREIL